MQLPNLSQYDTIYLGSQTWAMTLSQPMKAFLLEYGGELSNKKIAPFLSEGGYGSGDSTELIREFIARDGGKNNTYTSALVVDGNRVDESDVEVKRWLKNI
jgi:phosphoribosylamine--glycine ligase